MSVLKGNNYHDNTYEEMLKERALKDEHIKKYMSIRKSERNFWNAPKVRNGFKWGNQPI